MKILNGVKVLIALGLVFLMNSIGYAQDFPTMTIKFGDLLNRNFGYYQGIAAFKDEIEKRSGGKIKVDIITDNKMGTPKDALESLQLGAVQMGVNTPAYTQGSVKEHMIWAMPYLFKDRDTWQKFAYGPLGKELGDKIEPFGIKFLSWCSAGGRGFVSKKPLATPQDFSGLKIRSIPDPVVVEIIKSFSAQPVVMNIQEVYTSLQQGVIDGSELSIELVTAFKFNEVAKYYTETAHNGTPGMVLTNLAWWNKQPKVVQDLIEDVIQKNYIKANDDFYAKVDPLTTQQQQSVSGKVLTDKGITIVKPDIAAFKKASAPVIEQFKGKIGKDYVEKVIKAVGY